MHAQRRNRGGGQPRTAPRGLYRAKSGPTTGPRGRDFELHTVTEKQAGGGACTRGRHNLLEARGGYAREQSTGSTRGQQGQPALVDPTHHVCPSSNAPSGCDGQGHAG